MRGGEGWLFLFAAGVLVFNWPFLTILELVHGPGLFVLWFLFIAITAILTAGRRKDRKR